jgi:hypothetical protein
VSHLEQERKTRTTLIDDAILCAARASEVRQDFSGALFIFFTPQIVVA